MTTVREVVELPGMPGWVRFALALMAAALLRLFAAWAEPMVAGGWMWGHGLVALVALLVALDLLHSAVRKRYPLVLFLDLVVARLATGRKL
jgi:hypothetical protein